MDQIDWFGLWPLWILLSAVIGGFKGQLILGTIVGILFGPFGVLMNLLTDSRKPKPPRIEKKLRTRAVEEESIPRAAEESIPEERDVSGCGTGFFVNGDGYVLTNSHVVRGSSKHYVNYRGERYFARVAGEDKLNDLAVLKTDCPAESIALFREHKNPTTGEDVIVVGFPLGGRVSNRHTATTGIISSIVGFGDDSRSVQITAPVHGGNSGGPLLDEYGCVIGIVNAKINDAKIIAEYGEIPQNINFAIKSSIAESFLSSCDIEYFTTRSCESLKTSEIVKDAEDYVVKIETS